MQYTLYCAYLFLFFNKKSIGEDIDDKRRFVFIGMPVCSE